MTRKKKTNATKQGSSRNPDANRRLKNGDEVLVIAGSQKGKRGKIIRMDREKNRVVVQGVNKRKRLQRPSQENPQGGVIELEASIHMSNVMLYDSKTKRGVRIAAGTAKDGKKTRLVRGGEGREI